MSKIDQIRDEESLRDGIVHDFTHNYFIEAGAGAGKTRLVVDRITAQLASGLYKPEEIVAITFTNKAAQELSARIRGNLKKIASENPGNSAIDAALKSIGRMQISTIHSFCHRILKENCFDAGLRLDFELLEDEDTLEMKKHFFREWVKGKSELLVRLRGECEKNISYSDLENCFAEVCEIPTDVVFRYEDYDNVKPAVIELAAEHTDDLVKNAVDEYIKALNEVLQTSAADNTPIKGMQITDPGAINYLKDPCPPVGQAAVFFNRIAAGDHNPFRLQTAKALNVSVNRQCKEAFRNIAAEVFARTESFIKGANARAEEVENMKSALVNTMALDIVLKARDEYRTQVFNRRVSNDLLLQKTNKLLDKPEVVAKLRRSFKCFYCDECQDNDPVQNELILKIGFENGECIPGLLFVVGDVKQSIYRFRLSDYRLFNKTKELFSNYPDECKIASLNINNRSNEELVEFFNNSVRAQSDLMPGYTDMIARQGKRSDDVIHGVYKVIENEPETKDGAEPEIIVKLVKHLVRNVDITECNRETEELITRPVEYGDILILTANAKGCSDYVDVLQDSGIPTRIALEYIPGKMYPLRRFALIYRYLAMPFYKRAKEGILEIAQQNTSIDINTFNAELDAWKDATRGMGGAELAGWLIEKGEAYLFSSSDIWGCNVKRYQMAVRQMVDHVLSKCDDSPSVLAEAFLEYIDEKNGCEREIGYDREENAVRIMNIHKAKGLEGKICIIALRKDKNDKKESYTEEKDRYHVFVTHDVNGMPSASYSSYEINEPIREKADRERDMEGARLEYVAVTRAEEALIFLGPAGRGIPMFDRYISDDIPELLDVFPIPDRVGGIAHTMSPERIRHADQPDVEVTDAKRFRISPSSVEKHPVYKFDEHICEENDEDIEDVSESSELIQKRPSGDIFGTVMHRAFELAVLGIRNGTCDPILCINRAINENSDDIEARYPNNADDRKLEFKVYLEVKLPEFIAFIKHEVESADEVMTEYPFSLTVSGDELREMKSQIDITDSIAKILPKNGSEDSASVWINGNADLILVKGNRVTIWDYKSDKQNDLSDEDFANSIHYKYDNQMNLYKWVMSKQFKCAVCGKFYTLEVGEVV